MKTPKSAEVEVVGEPERNKCNFQSELRERGFNRELSRAFLLFGLAFLFVIGLLMMYIGPKLIWMNGAFGWLVVGDSVETILDVWIRNTPIRIYSAHALQFIESVCVILTLIGIWLIPHRSATATLQRSKVWTMATGVGLVGYFLAFSLIPVWFYPAWSETFTFHDKSTSYNRTYEMIFDPKSGSYNRTYEMIFDPKSGSYNRTYEMIFDPKSGSYNWICDMTFSILVILGQLGYQYQMMNVVGWIWEWEALRYYFQIIPKSDPIIHQS